MRDDVDLKEVEQTIIGQLNNVNFDPIPEDAAEEMSYNFRKLEGSGDGDNLLGTEDLQVDIPSFLDEDSNMIRNLSTFNIWDVTDPNSMKLKNQRRTARVPKEKKASQTIDNSERVNLLREALRADVVLDIKDFQVKAKKLKRSDNADRDFDQMFLKRILLYNRDISRPFFMPSELARSIPEKTSQVMEANEYSNLEEIEVGFEEGTQSQSENILAFNTQSKGKVTLAGDDQSDDEETSSG